MFASTTIANEIISRAPERNALGICKLVYLAQGWSLAFDRPIVADLPNHLIYGPIHLPVYDMLRTNLDEPIGAPRPVTGAITVHLVPKTDTETHDLLDQIVEKHAGMTSVALSSYCHKAGTPWEIATRRKDWKKTVLNTPMDEASIKAYFVRLAKEHQRKAA